MTVTLCCCPWRLFSIPRLWRQTWKCWFGGRPEIRWHTAAWLSSFHCKSELHGFYFPFADSWPSWQISSLISFFRFHLLLLLVLFNEVCLFRLDDSMCLRIKLLPLIYKYFLAYLWMPLMCVLVETSSTGLTLEQVLRCLQASLHAKRRRIIMHIITPLIPGSISHWNSWHNTYSSTSFYIHGAHIILEWILPSSILWHKFSWNILKIMFIIYHFLLIPFVL